MSIYRAVRTHLMQYAGITRLVSGRIYRRDLPQEDNALLIESSNLPAIVLNEVSTLHHNTQDGDTGLDTTRLQIDVIGVDPSDVDDLYRVIRNCLSGFQGSMSQYDVRFCFQENKFDNRMHDIQRERITADYRILYQVCEPVAAGGASTNELLALDADFVGSPLIGTAPLTVQFYDRTSGALPASWLWNFDGTNTSNVQNPNFIYSSAGTYNVSLTATADGGNSDTETKTAYIVVNPAELLDDSFTDTNGTALTSHTPEIGGPWVFLSGSHEIQSNAAIRSGGSNSKSVVDVGQADITLTSTFVMPDAQGYAGFIIRAQDTNNYWRCIMTSALASNHMRIDEVVAGVGTTRASASLSPDNGTFNVTITTSGTTITFSVTGADVQSINYASATNFQTETQHGILNFSLSNQTWDNIVII